MLCCFIKAMSNRMCSRGVTCPRSGCVSCRLTPFERDRHPIDQQPPPRDLDLPEAHPEPLDGQRPPLRRPPGSAAAYTGSAPRRTTRAPRRTFRRAVRASAALHRLRRRWQSAPSYSVAVSAPLGHPRSSPALQVQARRPGTSESARRAHKPLAARSKKRPGRCRSAATGPDLPSSCRRTTGRPARLAGYCRAAENGVKSNSDGMWLPWL